MGEKINIALSVKEKNEIVANENQLEFNKRGLKVFNLISSPGAGKTTLMESTAKILGKKMAVIVGDLATTRDADRIKAHGCQAIQIETGGGCHLNALMVKEAYKNLNLDGVEVLIIENVGNLVCPSTYPLGEHYKIAMLSLPEGDDKPSKYPVLFLNSDFVLINKIDLKELMDYNIEKAKVDCLKINSNLKFLEISAKSGIGIDEWIKILSC